MTTVSAHEAKKMVERGEARVASVFRHWSTGGLYVVLDLGKGSSYTVLDHVWEKIYRDKGLLREAA